MPKTNIRNKKPETPDNAQQTQVVSTDKFSKNHEKLYEKITLYRGKARKAGIKVDDSEIKKRAAVYKVMYPNSPISPNKIKTQLMVEKYFQQTGELKVDNQKIKQAYNELTSKITSDISASGEAKKALQAEIFFNSEDFRAHKKRYLDLVSIKRHDRAIPVEELIIHAQPDVCVAINQTDNTCFVTIKEFNASMVLSERGFPKSLGINRIRKLILKKYMSEKFTTQKVHKENFKLNSDSLLNRVNPMTEDSRVRKKAETFGRPVSDKRKLKEIYKKYHNEYFQGYDLATLQIVGSSDSIFIHSIHKRLLDREKKAKQTKQKKKSDYANLNIPWISISEDKLPWVLVAPTMKLKKGQFSVPIQSKFGFFIAKVEKVKHIPEVVFDDAKTKCSLLATREKFLKMDSVIQAKSTAYYAKNKTKFLTPDTLELKAWLTPLQGKKLKNPSEKMKKDTARYAAINISSLDLPITIKKKFETAVKNGDKKKFYGPINDMYGTWYFKIMKTKAGGIQIPYHVVRHSIIDDITALDNPVLDNLVSKEDRNEAIVTMFTAKAHRAEKYHEIQSIPDSEVLEMANSDLMDDSDFTLNDTEQEIIYNVREKLKDKIHKQDMDDYYSFLKTVEIQNDILSR